MKRIWNNAFPNIEYIAFLANNIIQFQKTNKSYKSTPIKYHNMENEHYLGGKPILKFNNSLGWISFPYRHSLRESLEF